jgi:hypothetical protein
LHFWVIFRKNRELLGEKYEETAGMAYFLLKIAGKRIFGQKREQK